MDVAVAPNLALAILPGYAPVRPVNLKNALIVLYTLDEGETYLDMGYGPTTKTWLVQPGRLREVVGLVMSDRDTPEFLYANTELRNVRPRSRLIEHVYCVSAHPERRLFPEVVECIKVAAPYYGGPYTMITPRDLLQATCLATDTGIGVPTSCRRSSLYPEDFQYVPGLFSSLPKIMAGGIKTTFEGPLKRTVNLD